MPRYFGTPVETPSGGITLPVLTSAPDGGFNPWSLPGAVQSGDHTFVGYIDGASGNVEIIDYSEAGESVVGPTVLHANLENDAHSSPALAIRSDDRLVAIYCKHNQSVLYQRISVNPLDSTSWGTETNLNTVLLSGKYTNPQLYWIGTDLYLVYRQEATPGTNSKWKIAKSTDGGDNWTGISVFYYCGTGGRSYLTGWSDGTNIHFVATNKTNADPHKIVHMYTNGTNLYKSDGTLIAALTTGTGDTGATTIYSGSDLAFMDSVSIISGNPVASFFTQPSNFDYHYARWNGASWLDTTIASNLVGYGYNPGETNDDAYGMSIDDLDPNTVWSIEEVSGEPELVRYVTANGGSTFTRTEMTSGGSGFQGRPIPVRFAGSPGLRVLWQYGTWTDYTIYSLGTKALHVA